MFYSLLKIYARLAIHLYCRKVVVNKAAMLKAKGPMLLAANHPNSFLDGIILSTLFEQNIYALARGDAFKKSWHRRILKKLHLLPVYRTSEGVENLGQNYTTFAACEEVFHKGGIVLIFSEARCVNEWHLRPLRKGTARLAVRSWLKGLPLTVVPVALNYNSFRNFGKNVFIHFGEPLNQDEVLKHRSDGKLLSSFNHQLHRQLRELVYEIDEADVEKQKQLLRVKLPLLKKLVLALPALAGALLHAPLYVAAKAATKIFFNNDHFDSVMASLLVLAYPFYLLFFFLVTANRLNSWTAVALLIFLPFSAWAAVQLKPQLSVPRRIKK